MLLVRGHDAAAAKRVQLTNHRLTNERNATRAVVASPGDDQDVFRAFDLLLTQPGLNPTFGVR